MSRSRVLASVALSCLVLVAACGGDDESSTTDAPSTEASAETSAPADVTVETTADSTTDSTVVDTSATTDTTPTTEAPLGSIIDVATASGEFTTLLAAVEAAGLTETLATSKVTVLAPTDAAFEALGQATIDAVLADPVALKALLLNHVLPAPLTAAQVTVFSNAVTMGGSSLPVVVSGSDVTIGGAKVITPDVMADNGIIHVIDAVLVPVSG